MNPKILIVEDDRKLRTGLRDNLEFEGYRVEDTWNFTDGLAKWEEFDPDLVLLDLMLPGRDGYQLLKTMRLHNNSTPVIILTARGEIWDKVKGFRLGCDDYIVKPFSVIELLERIKVLLRRTQDSKPADDNNIFADLELDNREIRITCGGNIIEMGFMEFELLRYFLQNPGRVLSRKELLGEVWKQSDEVETRTIDMHVSNLRKHLVSSRCEIQTVYKVGYRLIDRSDQV